MKLQLHKLFIVSVFLIPLLFSSLVPVKASTFHPFGISDTRYNYSFYFYPLNVTVSGRYNAGGGNIITVTDSLNFSSYGNITRSINGTDYYADTSVYNGSSQPVSRIGFTISFRQLLLDYWVQNYFSTFDFFILCNVFGVDTFIPALQPHAYVENVFPSLEHEPDSNSSYFVNASIWDSIRFSNGSSTYIIKISYNGSPLYFADGLDPYLHVSIGTNPGAGIIDNITSSLRDIDLGLVSGRIGFRDEIIYDPIADGWLALEPFPEVTYPSLGVTVDPHYLYRDIGTVDPVVDYLVPLGLIAISFFSFRMLLWKDV